MSFIALYKVDVVSKTRSHQHTEKCEPDREVMGLSRHDPPHANGPMYQSRPPRLKALSSPYQDPLPYGCVEDTGQKEEVLMRNDLLETCVSRLTRTIEARPAAETQQEESTGYILIAPVFSLYFNAGQARQGQMCLTQ